MRLSGKPKETSQADQLLRVISVCMRTNWSTASRWRLTG